MPLYVYGKTEQEVNDKIALNSMHAQRALARRAETSGSQVAQPQNSVPIVPRKRLTPDEVFQATTDLQNPAKAAEAVTKLVQDATGVDLRQQAMNDFKRLAAEWTRETPEFYNCKPNVNLLAAQLGRLVNGDVARISKEMITQTFHQMIASGDLIENPGEATPNVTPFPDENQVQRVETNRSGRSGTGTRSTNFRAPQSVQTRTLKYTREQIDRMSMAKTKALIESQDKDYAEACEFYYPSAKAMA